MYAKVEEARKWAKDTQKCSQAEFTTRDLGADDTKLNIDGVVTGANCYSGKLEGDHNPPNSLAISDETKEACRSFRSSPSSYETYPAPNSHMSSVLE